LDRYLPVQTWQLDSVPPGYDKDEARKARDTLLAQVVQKDIPQGYTDALATWKAGLELGGARIAAVDGVSLGRVIVGIGQKGPAEFGITLHHTWGLPILPGSSLKGIAAWAAANRFSGEDWARREDSARARDDEPNAYDALFGDVEETGAVIFHDAWFVPALDRKNGLHRDVLTVHHPTYYQKDGELNETDAPIPVPFITAKGSFHIAIELHPNLDPATHGHWLQYAWKALQVGLAEHGVGAKTNAGYGRIQLKDFGETSAAKALRQIKAEEAATAAANEAAQREATRLARRQPLSPAERIGDVLSDEGFERLERWFRSGGTTEVTGLVFDADHITGAAITLTATGQNKGIAGLLSPEFRPIWDAALVRATPRNTLTKEEIEKKIAPYAKKKEWDKAAKSLVGSTLDLATLELALEVLSGIDGVKGGHLKVLREEIEKLKSA
jgi:CRISPR-associated protein Cmr6